MKIDKDYRPRAMEFITISLDDVNDIKTSVPKFLDPMKATMPAYLLNVSDPEPAIDLIDPRWQGSLPATFLYNEKGEMVYKHIGRIKEPELRDAIEKVIKKDHKPPTGPMITPEVIAAHNLTQQEFERIKELLGREPSFAELGIFRSCGPNIVRTNHHGFI